MQHQLENELTKGQQFVHGHFCGLDGSRSKGGRVSRVREVATVNLGVPRMQTMVRPRPTGLEGHGGGLGRWSEEGQAVKGWHRSTS